jgi:Zn-dependent peptidase ImmA (M78 family)/transcriptional regulator with XRE-family HTH domain
MTPPPSPTPSHETPTMFNPNRLVLARHRREVTATALARAANLSTRMISLYENGHSSPADENVRAMAQALRFPESFFYREDPPELTVEHTSFRALSKTPAKRRDAACSSGQLAIMLNEWITKQFRLPRANLPSLTVFSRLAPDLEHYEGAIDHVRVESPEIAADAVRANWGLGNAPVPNLLHLLESQGVRIYSLAENCREVDAFSFWHEQTPFIVLNTTKSGERGRFDAAHELGHLILHHEDRVPQGPQAEQEADRFAAAFLMPRASVLAQVPSMAPLDLVLEAKTRWRVSAMALTHRLHEIGLSSDWHYRQLCVELSKRGYRSTEPGGIPRESSQVLGKVFAALRAEGLRPAAIARELDISAADLNNLVFGLVLSAQDGGRAASAPVRPKLSLVTTAPATRSPRGDAHTGRGMASGTDPA